MSNVITAKKPQRFGERVIIDARYDAVFDEAMFTPEYWHDRQAVVGSAGGRGQVLYVEHGGEQWVLRHYHRGGAMHWPLKDRYLWSGPERTRSLREWRLLAGMYAEGLPVPRPLAARFVRYRAYYRADLLTERIPRARALSEIVSERLPAEDEWVAIGGCIRRLHDAGVFHADLNAHNILLDEESGRVYIVDFDRGRRRRPGRWTKANLKRLNRSLHKIGLSLSTPGFEDIQWPALVKGYNG